MDGRIPWVHPTRIQLYIVDVQIPVFAKLKRAFALFLPKGIRLINFGILGKLAICFYFAWGQHFPGAATKNVSSH